MDERVKFIARFLEGEKVARLADDFGISRKAGCKILKRHEGSGVEGLTDRSRRPYRHANELPFHVEDRLRLVSFMDYDLGYFDGTERRLEPHGNPFGPKLLPMPSE